MRRKSWQQPRMDRALEEVRAAAAEEAAAEMGVDECLKAVMSLVNEGVAEFQQKFILALLN